MPNPYETWRKYSPHEVIIFPKFHKNWEKIVDFLPEHLDFTFSRLGWTGLYLIRKGFISKEKFFYGGRKVFLHSKEKDLFKKKSQAELSTIKK